MSTTTNNEIPLFGSPRYLLLLLLPPFWSVTFCIYSYIKQSAKNIPVIYFLAFLSLFYSYLSPIYDVVQTIESVSLYYPSFESLILSKLSVIALYYLTSYMPLQCMNIYHFIFFLSLLLIVLSVRKIYGLDRKTLALCVCCTSIVSLISLSFSTLASAVFCYAVCSNKNNINAKFLLLIIFAFLVHKSILFIAIPTIVLNIFMPKLTKKQLIYLILTLVVFMYMIIHNIDTLSSIFSLVGGDAAGYFIFKVNEYTGDGVWGTGYDRTSSMSELLGNIIQYVIIAYVTYKSLRYFMVFKKENSLLLSAFLINTIVTISSIDFFVLSERYLISNLILAAPVSLLLLRYECVFINRKHWEKIIVRLYIFFFVVTFYSASPVMYSQSLMKEKARANEITRSTMYIPSLLLLDIETYGFNDEMVSKNNI